MTPGPTGVRSRARQRELVAALGPWLEARLYVGVGLIVTAAIVDRLRPAPAFTPFEDGLLAWDGTWYRLVAEHGYAGADDPAVRFFPLWPLLGRLLGPLTGGPGVALVVLANLSALVAGVLLYRLTLDEVGDRRVARRAVRLLALFPPAFVLVLAYSEALYLVLALGVALAVRRRRWGGAALAGWLAGLTRPVGALLGVLVLADGAWRERSWRSLGAAAAPLAGSLTFLAWSELALGDWSAPLDRQRELRGDLVEPLGRWIRAVGRALDGDEGELLHLLAVVVLVALTVVAVRRLSAGLASYAVLSTLVIVSAENLNSLERYALSAFPLVMAAALVSVDPRLVRWLPTASAVGLVALTILAMHGVYVP